MYSHYQDGLYILQGSLCVRAGLRSIHTIKPISVSIEVPSLKWNAVFWVGSNKYGYYGKWIREGFYPHGRSFIGTI